MERIITIELLGEHFKFKVDHDSRVDTNEVVDRLVNEVNRAASGFPLHAQKANKLAIVVSAALNIARQNVDLSICHGEFVNSVATRAARMDRMIASSSCY
ncbi:MAG: cell division protein ZapA [Desulfobacteraceae bacterium]|nr:cell division protein ZapA [Desulfobacteraceae bacterium]MCF8094026.1 cell division protein ZapA [Desulfobacteraceae bacterium]